MVHKDYSLEILLQQLTRFGLIQQKAFWTLWGPFPSLLSEIVSRHLTNVGSPDECDINLKLECEMTLLVRRPDTGALLSPAEICFTELKRYCERAKKGADLLVTRPGKPVMW